MTAEGRAGVEIGTAIVSYIEPHPGHAVDFNRWYELDHFPATVKAGPGVFAGARYVATRACKELRPPGRLFGDPAHGSYLAVAWVLPGKQAEWDEWVGREMQRIAEQDRLFPFRDHVHTAVYRCVGRSDAVDAVVALDRGHGGVVVVADEGPKLGVQTGEVDAPVFLTLERTIVSQAEPPPHNLALAFCADPVATFRSVSEMVAGAGFASPFLATIPGTDTYTDDL
jgi:hypothetical protein